MRWGGGVENKCKAWDGKVEIKKGGGEFEKDGSKISFDIFLYKV